MENILKSAELFLHKNYVNKFPPEISAPIMAHFAHSVVTNDLSLSYQDIIQQMKTFLFEEKIEEIYDCMDEFAMATADFVLSFGQNQQQTNQLQC